MKNRVVLHNDKMHNFLLDVYVERYVITNSVIVVVIKRIMFSIKLMLGFGITST